MKIKQIANYEEFSKCCSFVECKKEYHDWNGTEKYIVFSSLTKEKICEMFPMIAESIEPFMVVSQECGEVFSDWRKNERKYMRKNKAVVEFSCDSCVETMDVIQDKDHIYSAILSSDLQTAFSKLSATQARRVKLYLEGHSYLEISKIEKVSINCAWKSVVNGVEKLRENLSQYR